MSCGNISTGSSAKPMPLDIPVAATSWTPCYRIIPRRFPPIGLFETVADPDDLEAVFQIEAMTNARLRDEVGLLALLPPEHRGSAPRTAPTITALPTPNSQRTRLPRVTVRTFTAAIGTPPCRHNG